MSKHILFRDKKIHFSVQGNGKAIVMLHGFAESMEIWNYFIRKLSAKFTVISIDLPGHGRSECLDIPHTMENMADAVYEVIKSLNPGPCIMVGHSMGGYVTLAFAERYPKKLKGFTLFHSQAAADSEEARDNRDRMVALIRKDRRGFIRTFVPSLFDPGNVKRCREDIEELRKQAAMMAKEGIIAAQEGMKVRPDRTHILANAQVPVQFIIGKNDPKIALELIMSQTTLPPHSEITLLEGVGHAGFYEAREETYKSIKAFAERILS